jgi:hypothetical protein
LAGRRSRCYCATGAVPAGRTGSTATRVVLDTLLPKCNAKQSRKIPRNLHQVWPARRACVRDTAAHARHRARGRGGWSVRRLPARLCRRKTPRRAGARLAAPKGRITTEAPAICKQTYICIDQADGWVTYVRWTSRPCTQGSFIFLP